MESLHSQTWKVQIQSGELGVHSLERGSVTGKVFLRFEMGRERMELKKIEKRAARHVTFSKRRKGLIKKAKEVSVMCDSDVGLNYFFCNGKALRVLHFQVFFFVPAFPYLGKKVQF
ncbi:hypothetical protein SUGI_1022700 [Cryptomeria japonica]|nr:hypothetical protein SUGI_1022700 [Cryptomeria japonica]